MCKCLLQILTQKAIISLIASKANCYLYTMPVNVNEGGAISQLWEKKSAENLLCNNTTKKEQINS